MTNLFADLRFAARTLARSPGFTAVAVITLALGIGANTAIFSAVNNVLLRPLPFPEPERLVQLWETRPGESSRRIAPANYLDWRAQSDSFQHLASYDVRAGNLNGDSEPQRILFASVSSTFLDVFQVSPLHGRTSPPDIPHSAVGNRTAVLSHGFWQRVFGGDPGVIGNTIRIDGQSFTIIGVMPQRFGFPASVELWTHAQFDVPPLHGYPGDIRQLRDAWYFRVVGRLSDGVDLAAAQAQLDALAARLERDNPVSNDNAGVRAVPLHQELVGSTRPVLLTLLGSVGLVLLISCANVAILTLVRADRRRKELAVRTALGAGRGRIAVQLLYESLMLALAGGTLAVPIAYATVPLLSRVTPSGGSVFGEPSLDLPVLGFCLLLTLLAVVGSGLLPALSASRVAPRAALGERGISVNAGRGGRRLHGGLVIAQCALAVMVLISASLMLKSLWRLHQVEPGFEAGTLRTFQLSIPGHDSNPERGIQVLQRILDRSREIPGASSAALAARGPVDDGPGAGLRIEDRPAPESSLPNISWQVVSSDYFRTAGIPILRGRPFTESDHAESMPVAIINQAAVARFWPGENPIGRRINTGLDGEDKWVTIVGVAGSTKNAGLSRDSRPEMFRPLVQPARGFRGDRAMLLFRSEVPAETLGAVVRQVIWDVRKDIPVFAARTGSDLLGPSVARHLAISTLLSLFAGLALLLTAIGVYGVMSHTVHQRRHELGVRVALGATHSRVISLMFGSSLALVLPGLVLGVVGAVLATRMLRGMLFETGFADLSVHAVVVVVLLAVGILASVMPASRAARIQPTEALRCE